MSRIIFHIDVNSAFVSWLGAKLVREGKPDIRLVPSVVSGDPKDIYGVEIINSQDILKAS